MHRPARRFFAFGCSFTSYHWTTWADIVAADTGVPEYFNLAKMGGGNEFMFNRLMQVDQLYGLGEDDLVMVCWTNIAREDRYTREGWKIPGNIFTQAEYSEEFTRDHYGDPDNLMLHDFAFIKAARSLLEGRGCQWHFLQMLPVFDAFDQFRSGVRRRTNKFSALTDGESGSMLPSFYEVLWDDDIENKAAVHCQRYAHCDLHPSPAEHLRYLTEVFEHGWQRETEDGIGELERRYEDIFGIARTAEDIGNHAFGRMREPDKLPLIF